VNVDGLFVFVLKFESVHGFRAARNDAEIVFVFAEHRRGPVLGLHAGRPSD
jgi:hypothetical protein